MSARRRINVEVKLPSALAAVAAQYAISREQDLSGLFESLLRDEFYRFSFPRPQPLVRTDRIALPSGQTLVIEARITNPLGRIG